MGYDTNKMQNTLYYIDTGGVLLLDKNRSRCLIVHQRNSNLWSLPKGHAQGCENMVETGFRELFEETGIYLPHHKYKFHGKIYISFHQNGGCICVCSLNEDCDSIDITNIKDVSEIDCVKWVDVHLLFDESSSYKFNRFSNIILKQYYLRYVKRKYNFFQNKEQYSVTWRM